MTLNANLNMCAHCASNSHYFDQNCGKFFKKTIFCNTKLQPTNKQFHKVKANVRKRSSSIDDDDDDEHDDNDPCGKFKK